MSNELSVDLEPVEARLLQKAIYIWFGAATASDLQVAAFGFDGIGDLHERSGLLFDRIGLQSSFTPSEWTQLLLMAEIGFASDVQGAGVEWSVISGITDVESIKALRSLQRKLIEIRLFPRRGTEGFLYSSEY